MKRLYIPIFYLLLSAPLLAMDSYRDQLRERQEQVRRYHELQAAARNAQQALRAPRQAQEELDRQIALQLDQELNTQGIPSLADQLQEHRARMAQLQEDTSLALALQLQEEFAQELVRPAQVIPRDPAPSSRSGRRIIAPCLFALQDLLYLPAITGGRLGIEGVYHVYSNARVPENQDWSCGFHALYNMCTLEYRVCNRRIADNVFIDACRAIANDPHGWSNNDESSQIARRIGLPHAYNLVSEHDRIEVLFDTPTYYKFEHASDEKRAYRQAVEIRSHSFWQNLRRTLEQARLPICIHFSCNIMAYSVEDRSGGKGEPHAVLITVAKMANGSTAIYIFDNMNDYENNVSQNQICAHVKHIYQQLLG